MTPLARGKPAFHLLLTGPRKPQAAIEADITRTADFSVGMPKSPIQPISDVDRAARRRPASTRPRMSPVAMQGATSSKKPTPPVGRPLRPTAQPRCDCRPARPARVEPYDAVGKRVALPIPLSALPLAARDPAPRTTGSRRRLFVESDEPEHMPARPSASPSGSSSRSTSDTLPSPSVKRVIDSPASRSRCRRSARATSPSICSSPGPSVEPTRRTAEPRGKLRSARSNRNSGFDPPRRAATT